LPATEKSKSILSDVAIKIGLGGFPVYITSVETEQKQIQFFPAHGIGRLYSMTKPDLTQALKEFSEFDHVVFRLSGENPMEFIDLLRIYGLLKAFMDRTYSASFWSMDSHHLGKQEAKSARYFDHAFVAHSEYLHLFDENKSSYLPCAFSLASNTRLAQTISKYQEGEIQSANNKSLCAPFAAYPWQKRNLGYLKGLWAAEELGISNFFGTVRGGQPANEGLIQQILSHTVVLNLSLSNDLNMRNFEALALNKILLTNKVLDHKLLKGYEQNIVFLNPDLSDMKVRIIEALETEPQDISSKFLEEHSLWPRVEEITRVLLDKSGEVLPPNLLRLSEFDRPEEHSEPEDAVMTTHSAAGLLARTEWFSPKDFRKALGSAESKIGSGIKILYIWLVGLFRHVAARTIGRFTPIRSMVRAITARFSQ
jgi:hypothetical protein